MFDIDLQFRFLRKAAEACFEFGQASVAVATAWQSHMHAQLTSGRPINLIEPWPSWFAWFPVMTQMGSPQQNPALSAWQAMMSWPHAMSPNISWPATQLSFWPEPSSGVFYYPAGLVPWSLYQAPMIAMMVSSGVPYAVAAPTARAGTSALDAAEAAYGQWRLIFGNDEVLIDRDRPRFRVRQGTRKP